MIYFEKLLDSACNDLVREAQKENRVAVGYTCFHADDAFRIRTAGGGDHAAVAVQQHKFVFVLIGELLHHPTQSHTAAGGGLLARFAGVHFELTGDGRKAAVHGLLDAVVVAAGGAVEEHDLHQQHQQYRNEQTAPQPSPGDTASHVTPPTDNHIPTR